LFCRACVARSGCPSPLMLVLNHLCAHHISSDVHLPLLPMDSTQAIARKFRNIIRPILALGWGLQHPKELRVRLSFMCGIVLTYKQQSDVPYRCCLRICLFLYYLCIDYLKFHTKPSDVPFPCRFRICLRILSSRCRCRAFYTIFSHIKYL
jgi:hypothetical protein